MGFYFVVHTLLGLIAASAGHILLQAKNSPVFSTPTWFHHPIVGFLSVFGIAACGAAVITTFVNHGVTWAAITIAEVAFGAMVAAALPRGGLVLAVITSPISIPFIMGVLWKFWYV